MAEIYSSVLHKGDAGIIDSERRWIVCIACMPSNFIIETPDCIVELQVNDLRRCCD
jgi:hypothetical protein